MSGHSKWSTIKRQKGVADKKRGLMFTKLANAITIAVRQGGGIGDPEQNFKLRLAIEKARNINMPKETIDRSIERGQGKGDKGNLQEVLYEGLGTGGVGIIVEAATDNKQRTTPEIKNIFEKYGGRLVTPGAVSYQFATKGVITVKKSGKSIDDIFLLAADCGAEDVEEVGEEVLIYTPPDALVSMKDELHKKGLRVESFELTRKPIMLVPIKEKGGVDTILTLVDRLEEHQEVQEVYTNFDIPDNILNSEK